MRTHTQTVHAFAPHRYNALREAYGLPRHETWTEVTGGDERVAGILAELYGADGPNACDAFVCGLCEPTRGDDAALGELFAAIVRDQFRRSRDGDPHWYERTMANDTETLRAIRRRTLLDVIVDNSGVTREQLAEAAVGRGGADGVVDGGDNCGPAPHPHEMRDAFRVPGHGRHGRYRRYRRDAFWILLALLLTLLLGGLGWAFLSA